MPIITIDTDKAKENVNKKSKMRKLCAQQAGSSAYNSGRSKSDCPYNQSSQLALEWRRGWELAAYQKIMNEKKRNNYSN